MMNATVDGIPLFTAHKVSFIHPLGVCTESSAWFEMLVRSCQGQSSPKESGTDLQALGQTLGKDQHGMNIII